MKTERILRMSSYHNAMLRGVCRRIFHGRPTMKSVAHSPDASVLYDSRLPQRVKLQKRKVVVCFLPKREIGPQMLEKFIPLLVALREKKGARPPWFTRTVAKRVANLKGTPTDLLWLGLLIPGVPPL